MKRSAYCSVVTCALAMSTQLQAAEPEALAIGGLLNATLVSDQELAVSRGEGIDVQTINKAELDGTLEGNTAINSVTGANIISNSAFANSSGLSTAIQNSGNNVLIQNSTIVNVVIEDSALP